MVPIAPYCPSFHDAGSSPSHRLQWLSVPSPVIMCKSFGPLDPLASDGASFISLPRLGSSVALWVLDGEIAALDRASGFAPMALSLWR